MGLELDREVFDGADRQRFAERLRQGTRALKLLLERPGFGVGEPSMGAELELHLVAAMLLGLTLALRDEEASTLPGMTFGHARRNFYQAARYGLDAELWWPTLEGLSPRSWTASALALDLMPLARRGLVTGGVSPDEADRHLEVLRAGVEAGVTRSAVATQRVRSAVAGVRRRFDGVAAPGECVPGELGARPPSAPLAAGRVTNRSRRDRPRRHRHSSIKLATSPVHPV
jgi:hypothetical protein